MKRAGRPRKEDVKPDGPFGRLLKQYLHHIEELSQEDFSQKDLADATFIPAKTLNEMVKGKRISGSAFRRDLRKILEELHRKEVLLTLEEANALITAFPAISPLDARDPEDAEIITLFNSPQTDAPPIMPLPNEEIASPNAPEVPDSHDNDVSAQSVPEPSPTRTAPVPNGEPEARTQRRRPLWWYISSIGAALLLILAFVIAQSFSSRQNCFPQTNGVTLYTGTNYQGQCHTFGPGDYELTQFGLAQNVSSITDAHNAYFIKLFDKAKNFFDLDKSMPILPAEWDKRADTIHIEKHRQTTCSPGSDGIIAFINPDYSGGCLFITRNIPDLTPLNFESILVSIQFVGNFQNTHQLVIYKQPNYKELCGSYWQNQSDLLQCARVALSVQVLPFTPPTPIPTVRGTHYVGNVALQATLSPGSAYVVVDGNLQTEWIGGHMAGFELHWAFPVTIHRVVVWDRMQSSTDNNQINKLKLSFSDGSSTGSIDMISQGPRCADITLPTKTVTSLQIIPVDASGNNGFKEIEVWATTGSQYSNNICVNKRIVAQTIP